MDAYSQFAARRLFVRSPSGKLFFHPNAFRCLRGIRQFEILEEHQDEVVGNFKLGDLQYRVTIRPDLRRGVSVLVVGAEEPTYHYATTRIASYIRTRLYMM